MIIYRVFCSDEEHFGTKYFTRQEKAISYRDEIINQIKNTYKLFGEDDRCKVYTNCEIITISLKTYGGHKTLTDVMIEVIEVVE